MHPGFEQFWAAQIKKVGKLSAQKAWESAKPPLDQCLAALAWQVPIWQRMIAGGDGRFVPHPSSWIRAGRWLDEPPAWAQQSVSTTCGKCVGGHRVEDGHWVRDEHGCKIKCSCSRLDGPKDAA